MKAISIIDEYENILSGKKKKFDLGTWNYISDAIRLLKYVIEEKLQWTDSDIKEKLCSDWFIAVRLGGMLEMVFNNSPYNAINELYPDKFKPWELSCPRKYWDLSTGTDAVRWLIEEKLKWNDNEIKDNINHKVFIEHNLGGLLCGIFNGSPYYAINCTYPDKFKPWEFNYNPINVWDKSNNILAVKWLIEEKLNWGDEQIKNELCRNTFIDNKLGGLLRIFKNSPYLAIESAYPGRFKPWELGMIPKNLWDDDARIFDAIRWVLAKKGKVIDQMNCHDLKHNGLNRIYVKFGFSIDKVKNFYRTYSLQIEECR